MASKKPWESKTILLNVIVGLCAAVSPLLPQAEVVKQFIGAHAVEIGVGWSLLNVILRAAKSNISLVD